MSFVQGIPGADLVASGLSDLAIGRFSPEAYLVAIGSPRLNKLGFRVPSVDQPEAKLYNLLTQTHGDGAHSQYNALLRRLVSFERALECGQQ